MTNSAGFRSPEQEVLKLLDECAELRQTLKVISAQLGRMESRVKNAFPAVAAQARQRSVHRSISPLMSREDALAEFDRIVGLVASGASQEAERAIEEKSADALRIIAKELGVSFPKSKPSLRSMREAVFGKVRESVLLSQHHPRP